jgi:hypothetical protein
VDLDGGHKEDQDDKLSNLDKKKWIQVKYVDLDGTMT